MAARAIAKRPKSKRSTRQQVLAQEEPPADIEEQGGGEEDDIVREEEDEEEEEEEEAADTMDTCDVNKRVEGLEETMEILNEASQRQAHSLQAILTRLVYMERRMEGAPLPTDAGVGVWTGDDLTKHKPVIKK